MAITGWDPFRDLAIIQERMNKLFEDTLARFPGVEEPLVLAQWYPAVDIYETSENIVFQAELPGMNQEDINVEIKENVLILKGERKKEKEIEEENYYLMERTYGNFQRAFTIPSTGQHDQVKAKYKDGILEIILSKRREINPEQIKGLINPQLNL